MREAQIQFLCQEDPLEKSMANHSSIIFFFFYFFKIYFLIEGELLLQNFVVFCQPQHESDIGNHISPPF